MEISWRPAEASRMSWSWLSWEEEGTFRMWRVARRFSFSRRMVSVVDEPDNIWLAYSAARKNAVHGKISGKKRVWIDDLLCAGGSQVLLRPSMQRDRYGGNPKTDSRKGWGPGVNENWPGVSSSCRWKLAYKQEAFSENKKKPSRNC